MWPNNTCKSCAAVILLTSTMYKVRKYFHFCFICPTLFTMCTEQQKISEYTITKDETKKMTHVNMVMILLYIKR